MDQRRKSVARRECYDEECDKKKFTVATSHSNKKRIALNHYCGQQLSVHFTIKASLLRNYPLSLQSDISLYVSLTSSFIITPLPLTINLQLSQQKVQSHGKS